MSEETNIHRESRLAKLRALEESGYNPYPYRFQPTAFAADLQEKYKDLEAGTDTEDRVTGCRPSHGCPQQRHVYRH